MPYMSYFVFLGLLLLCSIFSGWASMRVHSSYNAFSAQKNASHMTGYDTAVRLLRANGVYDISVGKVKGNLTDHFDPKRQIVNLSDSTYGNDSVAAVAVAALAAGGLGILGAQRGIQDLALVDPDFNADLTVGRVSLREAVVDVCAKRLQRDSSLMILLASCDLGTAETSADHNLDKISAFLFRSQNQRRLQRI